MVFFLNLIFSMYVCYMAIELDKKYHVKASEFFLLLSPMLFIWLMICAGQNDVGKDYQTYISIFNGEIAHYENYGEWIFVYIVKLCNYLGLKGQGIYYIFYSINFIFMYLILVKIKHEKLWLYVCLWICVTGYFNNQLNGLRQFTSGYIGTYAALCILENKRIIGAIFIIIAFYIHHTSLIFLLFYIPNIAKYITPKVMYLLIICGVIGSISFSKEQLAFLAPYIDNYFHNYAYHLIREDVDRSTSLLNVLTKWIFVPLYLLAIYNYSNYNFSNKVVKYLFCWGIVAFSLRLFLLQIITINRVPESLQFISVIPLLVYFSDLIDNKKLSLVTFFITGIIMFYFSKVVLFPEGEYLYKSIYF